jgi:hypothetical protein
MCDGRGIVPGRNMTPVACPCAGCDDTPVITANHTYYNCDVCGASMHISIKHNHADEGTFNQLLMALDDIGGKMRMGSYHDVAFLAFIWEQNRNKILTGETTWQQERRSVFKE